jgi:flagellar FliJ protein
MKKFFTRLEKILSLRRTREGSLRRELEHALFKRHQSKEQEKTLLQQIEALTEEIHSRRQDGKLDLQETYTQILRSLNDSLLLVKNNLLSQEKHLDELKDLLKEAIQERKFIEKIKEKHYSDWRLRQNDEEGALLDEIALKKPSGID